MTMKEKFTKGDWSTDDHFIFNNETTVYVCEVLPVDLVSKRKWARKSETEANAHLIAAAPKMYRMLNSLANGEGLQPGDTIERLLAEARGE
jgi:hypothetical protein